MNVIFFIIMIPLLTLRIAFAIILATMKTIEVIVQMSCFTVSILIAPFVWLLQQKIDRKLILVPQSEEARQGSHPRQSLGNHSAKPHDTHFRVS